MFTFTAVLINFFIICVQNTVCDVSVSSSVVYQVPDFTAQDLISGRRDDELARALVTTGLLAIRVPIQNKSEGGTTNEISALAGLCECKDRIGEIPGGKSTLLTDGRTTRSTIATATFGSDRPLSLPSQDIDSVCGQDLADNLDEARDYVAGAAGGAFVPALDRLFRLSWRSKTILPALHGNDYKTVSSIIEEAKHLEHFHVYSKMKEVTNGLIDEEDDSGITDTTLDWHTDAGLFLAFIPAVSCADVSHHDHSFHIKVPTIEEKTGKEYGKIMRVGFPTARDGEAVVALMLGEGAEHWLHTPPGLKLRATRHAVRMKSGEERAWYGMMHLIPQDAIVEEAPDAITFGKMQRSIGKIGNMSDEKDISVGCGNSITQKLSPSSIQTNRGDNELQNSLQRRRLSTVEPEDCYNSTNLFCWMSCQDIPDDGSAIDRRLEEGESVYCLDPAVLSASKDLFTAVEACTDPLTNIVGGNHRDSCGNTWHRTERGVPTYLQGRIIDDSTDDDFDYSEKYCWGATSMHMQGFEWEGLTCVVYLFKGWIINSRGMLLLACLGTIIIGTMVEFLVRQRPIMIKRVQNIKAKLAISVTFYGMQLSLAYFLMLVVMTYSGPLVLCVVLGLMLGHIVGNWGSDFSGVSKNTAAGNSTPCCNVESINKDVVTSESNATSHITEENEIDMPGNCCSREERRFLPDLRVEKKYRNRE